MSSLNTWLSKRANAHFKRISSVFTLLFFLMLVLLATSVGKAIQATV